MSCSLTVIFAGQAGVSPNLARMVSTDTLATVTTPGYLNASLNQELGLNDGDFVFANFNTNSVLTREVFTVSIATHGLITLTAYPPAIIVPFNVIVTAAQLANAGKVILVPSSGNHQYRLITMFLNAGGTNFSGGSGNRLGQITDGTTVYGLVSVVQMENNGNEIWGADGNFSLPAGSIPINQASVAGAPIVFSYSGGTTDYTAGSYNISGYAERIA